MKRIFLCTVFMCTLLIISLFFSMTIISVGFPSSTKLYVNPSKVEYWTPALGETFMINVSIANVSDLKLFAFKLYWNTTLLDLVGVDIQPFLNPPISIWVNETREDLGRYGLAIASTGEPTAGSGALVTLSFKITYEPTWPENVTSALDLRETALTNYNYDPIPHEVFDGEYSCYSTPPLGIAIMTDKPWYWLMLDNIHIYGNLTLGSLLVLDGIVALEVDNRLNEIIVIRSLLTGTPPANQTVEIIDVTPNSGPDNWTPKNSFNRGEYAYFNVTIKNSGIENRRVLGAVNMYDATLTPLGMAPFAVTVVAGKTASMMAQLPIPKTASVGDAWVYTNALTGWPRAGGTAYCPEKSVTIEIKGSSAAGATTQSLLTSSNSSEGTYDLTLELSFDDEAGNYTIYANSNYTIHGHTQKATNTATFEVKVPDINHDGIVDIVDIVTVAIAFGSALEDDPETPWDETLNWNPDADLNEDLKVDIIDIVMVALHFGWGAP